MDKLAAQVAQWIESRADKEWRFLIGDDDEIIPDEDALLNQALEEKLEWMADELRFHPTVQKAIQEARIAVRESAEDAAAYLRAMNGTVEDQLRYYGMSTKDFI